MDAITGYIEGLGWHERYHLNNGKDSFVIPYPTIRPVNIVFHGEQRFQHGHYGIHLGQKDRLTFLGISSQSIIGHFVDCRRDSPTLHQRVTMQFHPDSKKTLHIPAGVGHAFTNLERVFTINDYVSYLPDPERWAAGSVQWTIGHDVINVPLTAIDTDLPIVDANDHEASDMFYQLLAEHQQNTIPQIKHEYPSTADVALDTGSTVRVTMHKRLDSKQNIPEWIPIDGIDGLGWQRNLVVWSGDDAGFIPLLEGRPLYIIDHGEEGYSHDAYGIHLGQEDHLIFLGSSTETVRVSFADCREGSATLHHRISIDFHPSPLQRLIIPNGVAHRFDNLERVFTLNCPSIFVTNEAEYQPGNDVIDWPVDRTDFPILHAYIRHPSESFYMQQVASQKALMSQPAMHTTPLVLMTEDTNGNAVKVALRKKTS